jgi:hypothetical protein
MDSRDLVFVIPTYRLRDVGETVEQYDQHFWRNGHSVRIMVFDDSSPANQDKYFALLEQTTTHNEVYYVGPSEKEHFLAYLSTRLCDPRLDGLIRNLFRPSYGGNRNCALMYTLGALVVSSDDDMRPYALMEDSPESLEVDEISRGRLHRAGHNHIVHKSFDIMAAFKDVLGKPVAEIPENYGRRDRRDRSSGTLCVRSEEPPGRLLSGRRARRDHAHSGIACGKDPDPFVNR